MKSILATIGIRFALCSALTWLLWEMGFGVGTVFMAGAFGIALAKPLIELAGALRHGCRAAVWRPVQGRYYAFRQRPIDVVEDEDGQRAGWRLAEVRAVVATCAHGATLQVTYGGVVIPARGARARLGSRRPQDRIRATNDVVE
ncbi:MAG: hypothetical protein M3Z16_02605 [Pseudomonadota bacterium]|nr:hypothetical protein [Pseudomonadota bacterium]